MQAVSSYDLLVIKDLGHGISRGVMDLERPFQGSYVPPDRYYQEISNNNVEESQSEVDQVLKTNELLASCFLLSYSGSPCPSRLKLKRVMK